MSFKQLPVPGPLRSGSKPCQWLSDCVHSAWKPCFAVSGQRILLCGLMTFCTGMEPLCFFAFIITVYTEPSAFSSVMLRVHSKCSLQRTSAPLQWAWLRAYRPSAFSLRAPGLECPSLAPCSSLWLEHSHAAWVLTFSEFCSTCGFAVQHTCPRQEGVPSDSLCLSGS